VLPKTDAGGEIDAIDPGGYDPVTINKSILIDGTTGSGFASILAPRSSAIVIKAGVNDVIVLRNLSLNGVGSGVSGIHIVSAARVIVENCVISGFQSSTGGIGIHDERTADSTLSVVDTKISNNNLGVVIETTGTGVLRSVFDNVRVYGNILHGIRIANGARSVISQSVISNNVSDGIIAEQAAGATGVNINTCVISGNGVGIRVTGGLPTGRLNNSLVANNGTGILLTSGVVRTYGNNRIIDNGAGNAATPGNLPYG